MTPAQGGCRSSPRARARRAWSRRHASLAIALIAAVLGAAACGGSSHPSAGEGSAGAGVSAGHDPVTNGTPVHRAAKGTGGTTSNDDKPTGSTSEQQAAAAADPCRLVSRSEAQSIVGGPVAAPTEAPLGPTCIYQPVGRKSFITLAVVSAPNIQHEPASRGRRRFLLGGRSVYCTGVGQSATYAALGAGRVLEVAAPCAIGRGFVARALSRLGTAGHA